MLFIEKKNTTLVFVQWNLWWRYFSWKLFTKWKRSLRKNVSTKNTTAVPATANVVSDIKRMVIFWWAKKRLLVHMFLQIKNTLKLKAKKKKRKKEYRCKLFKSYCSHNPFGNDYWENFAPGVFCISSIVFFWKNKYEK